MTTSQELLSGFITNSSAHESKLQNLGTLSMSSYKLTIQFKTKDVHIINESKQQITLVKEVHGSNGSPVSWVTFSPFENNVITWEEEYGIYVSITEIKAGANIIKTSAVNPATSGVCYPFDTGAFKSPETGKHKENSYNIKNETSKKYTFGMAQSVIANGKKFDANPLNAVPVLSHEPAEFTPIEKLQVFLHAEFDNGVIITHIDSKALSLDLTDKSTAIIHYDQVSGQFLEGSL